MRQRLQEWLEQFSHKPLDELTARADCTRNQPRAHWTSARRYKIYTASCWRLAARCRSAPSTAGLPRCWARPRWRCCSSKACLRSLSCWKTMPRPCAEVWPPFSAEPWPRAPACVPSYAAVVARHGRSQTHKALAGGAGQAGGVRAGRRARAWWMPRCHRLASSSTPGRLGCQPAEALQAEAAVQRWRGRAKRVGRRVGQDARRKPPTPSSTRWRCRRSWTSAWTCCAGHLRAPRKTA